MIFFQFYGYLSQQQNMMQDYIRTATYQRAILSNLTDFRDKVILDVGAGSGILSFFAAQAGAKKVYAVEASSMAEQCQVCIWHHASDPFRHIEELFNLTDRFVRVYRLLCVVN